MYKEFQNSGNSFNMTVFNALFLYLNDKLSYSKCQRTKISVNYVHYDNIYFKSH